MEKDPPTIQSTSTTNADGGEQGGPTQQTQTQMVPVEAALNLAAEVSRLREEVHRLQGQEGSEDTVPPPYVG